MSEYFVYPEDMSDYEDIDETLINTKDSAVFVAEQNSGVENKINREKNIENNKNNVNEISINKSST